MRLFLGRGLIGTALGGSVLGLIVLRRRRASDRVASQIAPPNRRRKELEGLTKEELYERARRARISGRSKMSKADLIKALRATT
jgi:hypothetical protein